MGKSIVRIITAASLLIIFSAPAFAVAPKPSTRVYEGPSSVPAQIEDVTYVTGIPEIDVQKYTQYAQYNGMLDLGTTEAIFYKTRIDQKDGKGTESVEMFKIPYSAIKELYFGYDAVFKAANDTLPTALNTIYDRGGWPLFSARSLPLHMYMKKRAVSPIIVIYERGKNPTSIVFMAPDGPAKTIYLLLGKQAGLKVKEPKTTNEVQK
ncbi:MAG: hypothetical protein WC683_14330 [bacterium]